MRNEEREECETRDLVPGQARPLGLVDGRSLVGQSWVGCPGMRGRDDDIVT